MEFLRLRLSLSSLAFVAAIGLGVFGLADALPWWVAAAAVGLAVLAAWPRSWPRVDIIAARLLGATIVAALALVGVNVVVNAVVDLVGGGRPPILLGLAGAVVVFALAAAWYLWGARWGPVRTWLAAVAVALVVVIGAPILAGTAEEDSDDVALAERVRSKLDVLIVTSGARHRPPANVPLDASLRGFDVRYAVGFADREQVRWTLTGGSDASEALRVAARGAGASPARTRPPLRADADPVLVLVVDGTAPVFAAPAELPDVPNRAGEVARWRNIARDAAPRVPAFALLQTTRRARLQRWKRFVSRGEEVSVQALGSQTITDAAVRLAVATPTAQADFTLAMRFRPILLFDHKEPVPRPLSIAALFEDGRVSLCRDRQVAQTDCSKILDARELENGGTHLKLRLPKSRELRTIAQRELGPIERREPAPTGSAAGAPPEGAPPPGGTVPNTPMPPIAAGSAIYVHPVSVERDGRRLLYLDYWWYLPDNPAGVGGGAFCGAGLVIPGVTCHDHESDWEGITVVVDRTATEPVVTAVQYAQHSSVVRYSWRYLRDRWDNNPRIARLLTEVADASVRPLVFIAKGTHASYPMPCPGLRARRCVQVVAPKLGEAVHRGDLAWSGNYTSACGRSSCLQMLPTREGGRRPALWNDFAGLWGERHCALTYYCDAGSPPTAPGRQTRYRHPTRYFGIVGADGRFRRHPFDL